MTIRDSSATSSAPASDRRRDAARQSSALARSSVEIPSQYDSARPPAGSAKAPAETGVGASRRDRAIPPVVAVRA